MRFQPKSLRIVVKLPLMIVLLCSIAVGAMAFLGNKAAIGILEKQGRARLSAALSAEVAALGSALKGWRTGVESQSISPVTRAALTDFIGAWQALPGDKQAFLQKRYVEDNPNPEGQKHLLEYTDDRDGYARAHRKYHAYYRGILEKTGYSDILLLDGEGNILFSVMKTADFGASLHGEALMATGLSRAYDRIVKADTFPEFVFEDFSDYPVGTGSFSAFMATPVLASNGALIGVFLVRIDAAGLVPASGARDRMGETGSVVTVGPDGRLRRAIGQEATGGDPRPAGGDRDPISRALAGESGVQRVTLATDDTGGATSLAAFQPFSFAGATWAVMATQQTAELFRDATQFSRSTLIQGGALMLVAGLIGLLFSRSLTRPLVAVHSAILDVARGKLDVAVPEAARGDEIGEIAKSLDIFRQALGEAAVIERQSALQGAALQAASAALMIVGSDLSILHVNAALRRLLGKHAAVLFRQHPNLNVQALEGRNLGDLVEAAGEVAERLKGDAARTDEITLQFDQVFLGVSVQRVGGDAVLEWKDRTREFRDSALIASIEQRHCLVEFRPDGSFLSANTNFAQFFGGDIADLAGRMIEDLIFVDPEKVTHPGGFLAGILSDGAVWGQFRVRTNDGAPVWVDGGISVVSDGNGQPMRIAMIGNDISRSRQAMETAQAQQHATSEAQRLVVAELGAALARLSSGDLTVSIERRFEGEYETLRENFNRALQSLLATMRGLVDSASTISQSADRVSEANDRLLELTETQAQTLADTAAELSQLTASVGRTADRATSASKIVGATREKAIGSGQVVKDAIEAMAQIEKSSGLISSITRVIDDIAFQTNLLALNAGVEAARAGDAGRGFAVVASEVRALSQRSSAAAREINDVIAGANAQIERGSGLVSAAGSALGDIFESVKSVAENVEQIAGSALDQSKGLAGIDASVTELDQTTRRNAGMLSELAAAGHALRAEAAELAQASANFEVGCADPEDWVGSPAKESNPEKKTHPGHAPAPDKGARGGREKAA